MSEHRKHHPKHPHAKAPLDLPTDAKFGHDRAVMQRIQEWLDALPADERTDTFGEKVHGYATAPNPASDGSFVHGAENLIFWWTEKPFTITMSAGKTFGL